MIRKPEVAGYFYPADPAELRAMVDGFLAAAEGGAAPKALIVPHAGYVYSGAIAATGYRRVPTGITRVVLLGPAHRHPFRGLAAHSADRFATPLGEIAIDTEALARLPVERLDAAHDKEHSLEVHLPFLQAVLGDSFKLIPLVVGDATEEEVAEVLDLAWGGPETLIVISSDLSHFHPYDEAKQLDRTTADRIEALQPVQPDQACGCRPIGGLLRLARQKGLTVEALDLRSSGDTAGNKREVVGYGAFAVTGRS